MLDSLTLHVARRSLPDAQLLRAREVRYRDGSGVMREEVSATADLTVLYRAATTGYRQLLVARRAELNKTVEVFEEEGRSLTTSVYVSPLEEPATRW